MPDEEVHEYTRDGLTVEWRPAICRHSGICARGLIGVFNPKRRPWVDMSAADLETIAAQVERCPSGALRTRTEPK